MSAREIEEPRRSDRVMLARVAHLVPFEISSIYKAHHAGRLPWLTRENPEGRRDRTLWVLIDEYDRWSEPRGLPLLSSKLEQGACAL